MKTNPQTNPLVLKMIVWVSCFLLATLYNNVRATEAPLNAHKNQGVSVNFKQNTQKDELTIRVRSANNATMQLFIFSPDGILVKEVAVSRYNTTTVKGLKNGFYLYECFNKDERMKSGSLVIK